MIDSATIKTFKQGIAKGLGIGVGISIAFATTTLLAAAAAMKIFSAGEVISADQLNRNFTIAAPEHAVMAFYQSDCPEGWALADGTNGTPDLRGRFIRGMDKVGAGAAGIDPDSATRALGSEQLDAFQTHLHWRNPDHLTETSFVHTAGSYNVYSNPAGAVSFFDHTGEPYTSGTNGDPRTSSETRPRNVALIYCMRKN